jgi:hypothetical protein
MQRPEAIHYFKDTVDEGLTLSIRQAAQRGAAAQMSVVVGITPWTLQRTFAGYFDGKRGALTL